MQILNFGSLNLDYVYRVEHIVQPGETIPSTRLDIFCGGKGLNQSVALARAGAAVHHAGMVGPDGAALLAACRENGIDASNIIETRQRSGNAIIQVSATGQNSIILFGGANRENSPEHVRRVLDRFQPGDFLLLQNEINLIGEIIAAAAAKGMKIALNPSPFHSSLLDCGLEQVSLFLMNEIEGEQITGEKEPAAILAGMRKRYPRADTVLTLGGNGAKFQHADTVLSHGVYQVPVVDTTAAGDTFTGYFLAGLLQDLPPARCLQLASVASSLAVSRPGAVASIPSRQEVEKMAAEWQ